MFQLSKEAEIFLKDNGDKKIVFTNGCFDILHSGHISYLNDAKALGDVLFIGLNSDSSVKALKGSERPINDEYERKFILENLKAVDFVEVFSDETPLELIKKVDPDFLVKGGDWAVEQIVGHEFVQKNGGIVKSLPFKDGFSTTNIIEKIKTLV
ncbi:MAG: D-glycero-beta-D-manno-heptose 1-phosphate adenylyltransferase [Halobacteriovorax sp.]|nr:D-glycero-beta-D-manno-heptose 1-phosphate adenylyltransferase [Halobacteriovorax sp.]|tara:strand:+ start:420321 stop:420782 length:462 start_codon:yes stop_codon:yes gene_type:complete